MITLNQHTFLTQKIGFHSTLYFAFTQYRIFGEVVKSAGLSQGASAWTISVIIDRVAIRPDESRLPPLLICLSLLKTKMSRLTVQWKFRRVIHI